MPRLEAAALGLYAAAVLLCTILVIGYGDADWLGALIALTLPWSLISLAFIWSLAHGASAHCEPFPEDHEPHFFDR